MTFDPQAIVATPREVAARDRELIPRANIVGVKFIDEGRTRGGLALGFAAGGVAGFPRDEAQQLVSQGVANFDLGAALKVAAPPAVIEKVHGAFTAAAAGLVGVQFLRSWEAYNEGDCVDLSEGLARRLIAASVAFAFTPRPRHGAPWLIFARL